MQPRHATMLSLVEETNKVDLFALIPELQTELPAEVQKAETSSPVKKVDVLIVGKVDTQYENVGLVQQMLDDVSHQVEPNTERRAQEEMCNATSANRQDISRLIAQ